MLRPVCTGDGHPGSAAKIAGVPKLSEIYDVALVDLDGVVYVGTEPVAHAAEALAAARATGMRLAFVTNNAARRPETVAAQLTQLGVIASATEVVTSAQAAARLLADRLPSGARVLVVGGEGLVAALAERGLVPVTGADQEPAAVVSGFHPDVGWRLLAEGAYAVAAGLPWVASNVDPTIPMPRGLAPGNGALVAAIRMATGREPVVAGKPESPIHLEAILRTGARRPMVVGDRLDTDIEGAARARTDSLLVLTGVTAPLELVTAPPARRPTYLARDLRALAASPESLVVLPGRVRAGRYFASVEQRRVVVGESAAANGSETNDEVDLIRVICGVAWAAADRGEKVTGIEEILATHG